MLAHQLPGSGGHWHNVHQLHVIGYGLMYIATMLLAVLKQLRCQSPPSVPCC
jgi:hypothetical protein